MNLEFRLAEVQSVDAVNKTAVVAIRPDMQNHTIQLDNPLYKQYVPVPGQQLLICLLGSTNTGDMSSTSKMGDVARIICEFGDESFNLQKSKPIQSGEIMVQGQGGGFYYADQNGNAVLSDQTMSNVVQLLVNTAISMVGDSLSIKIKGVGDLIVVPKSDKNDTAKIEFAKKDTRGADIAKITIQDDKIIVQGPTVEIGTKETPYVQAGVVTSQSKIEGNHSFCLVSGSPIPCSARVTAANTPT